MTLLRFLLPVFLFSSGYLFQNLKIEERIFVKDRVAQRTSLASICQPREGFDFSMGNFLNVKLPDERDNEFRDYEMNQTYQCPSRTFNVKFKGTDAVMIVVDVYNQSSIAQLERQLFFQLRVRVFKKGLVPRFHGCFYDKTRFYLISERMMGTLESLAAVRGRSSKFTTSEQLNLLWQMTALAESAAAFDELKASSLSSVIVEMGSNPIINKKNRSIHIQPDLKLENFLYKITRQGIKLYFSDFDFDSYNFADPQFRFDSRHFFISPEQINSNENSPEPEVYSLGIAFWNLFDEKAGPDPRCVYFTEPTSKCFEEAVQSCKMFFESVFDFNFLKNPEDLNVLLLEELPSLIIKMISPDKAHRPKLKDVLNQSNKFLSRYTLNASIRMEIEDPIKPYNLRYEA